MLVILVRRCPRKDCKRCLRPHSVTVKGQICENQEYFGNPCKAVASSASESVAILFPGQGSQYPDMMDKLKHFPYVQELLSTAKDVFGRNLLEEEDISNTLNAQPLMFVTGLAHAELMKHTHPTLFTRVKAVAGFSLGEITALCFSGAITLVDAMRLVKIRSEAMSACNGGAMCNVRGLSFRETQLMCRKTGCTIANIICNHEEKEKFQYNIFVCAGTAKEVTSLVDTVERSGGKAKQLRVSGAFHSKHMAAASGALQKFSTASKSCFLQISSSIPMLLDEIKHNLKRHITSPVMWHSTVQSLVKDEGITTFVECGPMNVLSKTLEAILKDGSEDEESQPSSITIEHCLKQHETFFTLESQADSTKSSDDKYLEMLAIPAKSSSSTAATGFDSGLIGHPTRLQQQKPLQWQ
ncbi:malonyl CoA-ACP transacylase [Skeletonema marinoi]|uniref:[acyl-carrier-protein] S-malonyltransferase n=1 Tax=Skeletonema marinoi TaxID=267567 RepID=A0AAD8Y681_9STRA|nr:malonyl CoA-ACP transacylase [Skeletonema marinoi]